MADKKITELSALDTISADDLLVVVDQPGGIPVTKRTTAGNLFSFVQNTLVGNVISHDGSGNIAGNTVLRLVYTVGGNTNATVTSAIGASFTVNANALATNTATQYAIFAASRLSNTTANVKTEHAVAKFVLDVSNAASVIENTHGMIVQVANTGIRTQNVTSFIRLENETQNSTVAQTQYLFDANNVSANATNVANGTTLFSNSAAGAATHKLRVRVNGTDYWLLAVDTAS